ncbi:MAG TPA: FAD-binding protein [Natronosporangium sp.]|nr:FAD-binding protein [Natronosporangium sp.]
MSVAEAITRLQAQLNGRVITSRDPAYDRARAVFNGAVDRHPAAIAQPATAAEVARAVTLTRDHGLELAVRGGGHSGPGYGVTEGGIVLDLTRLRGLTVDVDGRTAWAQTGLTAGEYTAALAEHGLVTGFGDTGSVGIGGLTLGGGMGFLSRRYGLTVDNLLAARWSPLMARSSRSTPSTTRTCSGRSVAAAAISGSPPPYGSAPTPWRRWSAACSCSRPRPR